NEHLIIMGHCKDVLEREFEVYNVVVTRPSPPLFCLEISICHCGAKPKQSQSNLIHFLPVLSI
ncbi:MAG: hypothetical protein FD151_1779, partial [bacterium]